MYKMNDTTASSCSQFDALSTLQSTSTTAIIIIIIITYDYLMLNTLTFQMVGAGKGGCVLQYLVRTMKMTIDI
jgi:hypothetical protein